MTVLKSQATVMGGGGGAFSCSPFQRTVPAGLVDFLSPRGVVGRQDTLTCVSSSSQPPVVCSADLITCGLEGLEHIGQERLGERCSIYATP